MQLHYSTNVDVNTPLTVAYTAEAGDPQQFFFQVKLLSTGQRFNAGNNPTSGSGTFKTIPGDLGGHVIEAYTIGATPGKSPTIESGPVYTVLSQGSPASDTTTKTQAVTTTPPTASIQAPAAPNTPAPNTPPPSTPATTPTATAILSSDLANTLPTTVSTQPTTQSAPDNDFTPTTATSAQNALTLSRVPISTSTTRSGSVIVTFELFSTGTSTVLVEETASVPSPGPSDIASSLGTKRTNKRDAIIGGSIAGAVVLLLLLLCFLFVRLRRKWRKAAVGSPTSGGESFLSFAAYLTGAKHWKQNEEPMYGADEKENVDERRQIRIDAGSQMEWVLRPTNDPPPGYPNEPA